MSINHPYLQKVYQQVCARDLHEPEFLNAVNEVLGTLEPVPGRKESPKEFHRKLPR